MKRLNTRLDALEAAQNTNELAAPEKKLLVEILARVHALYWPWRMTRNIQPPMVELRRRQAEYIAGSVGVSAKGSGASADWKAAHELRRALIAAGMLTAVSAGGQITSVILTQLGTATAKKLVGTRLASGRQAVLAFLMLQVLTDERGTPVREHVLLGVPSFGDPSEWDFETEPMLALLVSGCVRATPDTVGRVLYSFSAGAEFPEPVMVDFEPEEWCDAVYLAAFKSERHQLENAEPRDLSEIFIAIGASDCWPTTETNDHEKI